MQFQQLDSGVHCLSNRYLDASTPKVQLLKKNLRDFLAQNKAFQLEELFVLMEDTRLVTEAGQDPNDNIFVKTYLENIMGRDEPYGTMSTTVIAMDADQQVTFLEKTWDSSQIEPRLNREVFSYSQTN